MGLCPAFARERKRPNILTMLSRGFWFWALAILALVCLFLKILRSQFAITAYFGGTSILIIVSVGMDTIQQVQSHLLAHQYEGLLEKSQLRGKRRGKKGGVTRR